jgi:hypothetical protein
MTNKARFGILAGVTGAAIMGTLLAPRIAQPLSYHNFADQRSLAGIPNAADVLSNIGFLLAGAWGLALTRKSGQATFLNDRERLPYQVLFAGVTATAFGSAYYHLAPNNQTLVWDRLPMTVGFMGLTAAMLGERISVSFGRKVLPYLIAIGIASVFYWQWTEHHGHGDLRFYGLVQFYPAVLIALLVWLFPARYTRTLDLAGVAGFYALAKVGEALDRPIYSLLGVSGHTLKHLLAAAGVAWLARMLYLRTVIKSELSVSKTA